ncbi:hypothetical protein PFISCL1PPCAC_25448 [Pristionchus fissidentatus]|uniref:Uncharacterized protein n=1 Tax=Pristionchus fissidentatus TaxID=1538716 RepID=A0AAV5WQ81_9BILA|nr:hypothetical protein PFISCL1PPCAC_25448 [Pristionchus fissidentatus]
MTTIIRVQVYRTTQAQLLLDSISTSTSIPTPLHSNSNSSKIYSDDSNIDTIIYVIIVVAVLVIMILGISISLFCLKKRNMHHGGKSRNPASRAETSIYPDRRITNMDKNSEKGVFASEIKESAPISEDNHIMVVPLAQESNDASTHSEK